MKKLALLAATTAAFAFATGAQAQSTAAQPYIGLSGGYHDLHIAGAANDDGAIAGVLAGVDVPVGET
ncbi:MAG: hypothetical protein ACKOUM_07730, partial [Sphingopyxis sp.]